MSNFPKNKNPLIGTRTCAYPLIGKRSFAYQGVKNVRFPGNFEIRLSTLLPTISQIFETLRRILTSLDFFFKHFDPFLKTGVILGAFEKSVSK